MQCFHCSKNIPVPNSGLHVTISLVESTDSHSVRIGDITFHSDCFFEVAGEEYKEVFASQKSFPAASKKQSS